MTLKATILDDLKKAMLAKDVLTRDTLRMVKAELMNLEIAENRDATDEDVLTVLARAVKTRTDSIAQYEEGGRPDAAEAERQEITVVERYLPKKLDEAALRAAVEGLISELGLSGKKDMGRVMKELKSRHGAAIDGRTASKLAGELLG
ncbi:MAG: GatB/YqeY domain-containing protein [Deltaproteobacteria bacterium]|nr:MAG: GatB/YqeY domain-containing protein [Deltaproteobacteria bacterium]